MDYQNNKQHSLWVLWHFLIEIGAVPPNGSLVAVMLSRVQTSPEHSRCARLLPGGAQCDGKQWCEDRTPLCIGIITFHWMQAHSAW